MAEEFVRYQKVLLALGDENRRHMILAMMRMPECDGVRVGRIMEACHLSRPAVSHHLRVLMETGIVKRRQEGTKNYYYFDAGQEELDGLLNMLAHAREIMGRMTDRSGEV